MVRLRVILWHTEGPSTVASFRTWRGLKASVAQSPKPDNGSAYFFMLAPAERTDNEEAPGGCCILKKFVTLRSELCDERPAVDWRQAGPSLRSRW